MLSDTVSRMKAMQALKVPVPHLMCVQVGEMFVTSLELLPF